MYSTDGNNNRKEATNYI